MVKKQCTAATPMGEISYELIKKRVKNLNLCVERSGRVVLSVPANCSDAYAEQFIVQKGAWILQGQARLRAAAQTKWPPLPPRPECKEILQHAVEQVYPLVEPLGVEMPEVRVRKMKSQWGNCHWMQGYITMNVALVRCPEELQQYVALHELVHFLHPDHGAGFCGCMERLMPDWRDKRGQLKDYIAALER